ncbi:MAG: hypothetical protein IRZ16_02070 [Myxococcaceae bacterium]|nr:hypothetical protein [Myxococcaceae bacterium]
MKSSSVPFVLAIAAVGAALALTASCGSSRGDCSPQNCSGCCDEDGTCQPGFLADACGLNGAACAVCTSPQFCGNGVCMLPGTGGGADGGGNDGGTPDGGGSTCEGMGGDRVAQVCARWKCERADLSEGTWNGNVAACNAGDNPDNRTRAVKLVNLYRFLAQLPEVTHEATRDQQAQQCALMMDANDALSHMPPVDWECHTAEGALAASKSNIASAPGVQAIDLYMVDFGNPDTLGHRRWILSPKLGPVGSGTTSSYSCLYVIGGTGTATREYVAWPPPGPFPLAAFAPSGAFGESVNSTGWSIQSETIDLGPALVSVSDVTGGETLPVTVTPLLSGYGSKYALRFNPDGWTPQAGHSYRVLVTGVSTPISYQVDVIDCP